ncbi:prolyl oligopeptidase family serine peptidase [Flavobacterium amniphilum]|uniref:prolyl oligopeptidase family serine peptidase n=1 Tax=Flavobacterium amniphilum TaxID=1834035 RepID=UPI00202A490B|nr:prolyl oligopeptidase family serine peptidase [Flavobacterium amniphilum]MCL9807440.1 prolyl oligopeptidase family serine peptidase [Flavobacterium amniphilum]
MEKPLSETFFGRTINDNYRYVENPNDTLVQQWFKQSNVEAREILDNISGRKELVEQFIEFEKRKTFSVTLLTITENDFYFYVKKTEKDKSGKLFYKKTENGEEILLFDPVNYKKELGYGYSISYLKPSWDNKTIAVSFSKNGEEIGEIAFLDISTKTLLPEIITHCWPAELGGISWLPDNSGIIYIHIPEIDNKKANYILNTESVIYKLGDNQNNHKIILSQKNNPEIKIEPADFPVIDRFSLNDDYLLGTLSGATVYIDYYYAKIEELNNEKINWKLLFKKDEGIINPIIINNDLYCLSSKNASNFKIIKTSMTNPDFQNAEILVREDQKESIDDYLVTKDGLFYTTTKNGVEAKLYFVRDNTEKRQIDLPIKAGNIKISTNDKYGKSLWITISGWLNSKRRFNYNVQKNQFTEDNISPKVTYPEFNDFMVEEIEVPSHDGVLIPVSIIHKKGIKKNKENYILMSGYGSYGASMSPRFQPTILSWVMNDGIYVVPHVRGGGEKGDRWHNDGFKDKKHNTWKDFIAVAEYLIKEKITTNKKIATLSGSAGAILVGRAITERPDLFKVMLCYDGMLNPLRINQAPNGPNNIKELGNPDIKEEFNMLCDIDSYHHIKKGVKYPACLISVGMNDARVAPWMSGKFVVKLKSVTVSKNPILFAVNYDTGHGIDNSNLQLYNDYADEFAFAFWQMGHPKFKLLKK